MTRFELVTQMSLTIAKQAIASGNHEIDLTWLDTDALLRKMEELGMIKEGLYQENQKTKEEYFANLAKEAKEENED